MARSVDLVAASTFITLDAAAEATDGETVVIAGKTYTFRATVGATDGSVHIGAAVADTVDNLVAAINLDPTVGETGTEGTDYGANMTINPHVTASRVVATGVITLTAKARGTLGNFIPVTAGTSDITVDNATLENGTGSLEEFITGLQDLNQVPSEVIHELVHAFPASDDNLGSD